MAMVA